MPDDTALQADFTLDAQLARLRGVFDAAPMGVGVVDLRPRIVYANRALTDLLGYALSELSEMDPFDIVSSAFRDAAQGRFLEVTAGRPIRDRLDWALSCKNGRATWARLNATLLRTADESPLAVLLMFEDITAQKRTEEQLLLEKTLSETIVDSLPGVFYVLDDEGRFVRWNATLEQLSGIPAEQLLGMSARELVVEEERAAAVEKIRQAFTAEHAQAELRVHTKDGVRHYLCTGRRMSIGRDYAVGCGIDISDRKQSEQALREAHDLLEQRVAERTAELSKTVAQLHNEVLERTRAEEAVQRERRTLERLLRSSDHERQLIAYEIHDGLAQLLAGAIMQLQMHESHQRDDPAAAAQAIRSSMDLLRKSLSEARRLISGVRPPILDESGVVAALTHLTTEHPCRPGTAIRFTHHVAFTRLDPLLENAVYRIVQECLTNACKHSRSEEIRVELTQSADTLTIEIRDWGVGFDPQSVAAGCFGLEGVAQRARLLGGAAKIESSPGQGTRIRVTLPIVLPQAPG